MGEYQRLGGHEPWHATCLALGESRDELGQAVAEAGWLQRWIHQHTQIDLTVKPVLAVPGWYVDPKASGPVAVENEKRAVGL